MGNWASATFMFITDDTDPTISLVSPEEGSTSPAGIQILLKVNDTHTITNVVYNWDATVNTTLAPPYDAIVDILLPAAPGGHVLRVYARDQAGNWASATYVFSTEETPPTTPTETVTTTLLTTVTTTFTVEPTDFLTVEIFLLAFGILVVVIRYRKKRKPEA
ncbi:MAG: hypothetical protein ACFFC7_21965 [Candidatus Hermodarchaeota archaeon]